MEESFEGAAAWTFTIMADPSQVRAARSVRIDFEEEDLELALVTWLNTLLAEAGTHGLVLGRFRLVRDNGHWQGEAWGEPWRADLDRGGSEGRHPHHAARCPMARGFRSPLPSGCLSRHWANAVFG